MKVPQNESEENGNVNILAKEIKSWKDFENVLRDESAFLFNKMLSECELENPEGHHSITPYLVVRNASKAIDFYKKAFDAEERVRKESPDSTSIMHNYKCERRIIWLGTAIVRTPPG